MEMRDLSLPILAATDSPFQMLLSMLLAQTPSALPWQQVLVAGSPSFAVALLASVAWYFWTERFKGKVLADVERLKGTILDELQARKAELDRSNGHTLQLQKSMLDLSNAKTLNGIEHELRIAAEENSIRFTVVNEKAIGVLAEVFEKLLGLHDAAAVYVSAFTSPEDFAKRRVELGKAYVALNEAFRPSRFYIPKMIAERITDLQNKIFRVTVKFMGDVEQGREAELRKRGARGADTDTWTESHDFMATESTALMTAIEDNLRELLRIK